MRVEPPKMVNAAAWGPPIYLAHIGEWHYESTEAAPTVASAPMVPASWCAQDDAGGQEVWERLYSDEGSGDETAKRPMDLD